MKKIYSILFAAAVLIAAASCTKNEINPAENDNSPVKVNINVASFGPDSKALKSGWEAGDKIHVYLEDASSYVPDFDLTYDGSKWTASEISSEVAARLTASGTLRGFWEASNSCTTSSSWEKSWYSFDFPGKDKKSTTGQIQYIVADFSSVSYTFDGSTLTANIAAWRFRANIQIVVTGISFSPGQYTLYSEWIDNFSGIDVRGGSAPYYCFVGYHATGSDGGRIGGIANDEGVAFVGGLSYNLTAGNSVTIYLVDNSTSTTYSFTKTATAEVVNDGTKVTGIKIPFSKFTPLSGKFSVSDTKKVYFSPGNLQATTSDLGAHWAWAFAAHQWDVIGNAAANTSINGDGTVSANGTVDLFGWVGASGGDAYGISNRDGSVVYYGNVKGESVKSDWGNNIGSGWRTPTNDEWDYILRLRTSGATVNGADNARRVYATINTDATPVTGMILFPDGVTILASEATSWSTINGEGSFDESTKCTSAQWSALAAKGCVFLPTTGLREGNLVPDYQLSFGYYWSSSSSPDYSDRALNVKFGNNSVAGTNRLSRYYGASVRLVRDVE